MSATLPQHTLDVFGFRISSEQRHEITALWRRHSQAEEARDIPGLLATLTEDCVYVLRWLREDVRPRRWEGHRGAVEFYTALLGAFQDIHFEATALKVPHEVFSTDGVKQVGLLEKSKVTGTHTNQWLDLPATGRRIEFEVCIFFPWDFRRHLFGGEIIEVRDP